MEKTRLEVGDLVVWDSWNYFVIEANDTTVVMLLWDSATPGPVDQREYLQKQWMRDYLAPGGMAHMATPERLAEVNRCIAEEAKKLGITPMHAYEAMDRASGGWRTFDSTVGGNTTNTAPPAQFTASTDNCPF